MTSTTALLLLTHDQARRLQEYVQKYRHYALTTVIPSTERNNTLRILQSVQGKLIEITDRKIAVLQLALMAEEMTRLKVMIAELLLLSAKQPESAERTTTLVDLVLLKGCLKGSGQKAIELTEQP